VQIIRYLILILFLAATGHLRATEFRSVQSYTLLAQEKLEGLKGAGDKAWSATKKGTDKAVDEVKKAYERVKSLF